MVNICNQRESMSVLEFQAMPSLRDVAHDGVLCTFSNISTPDYRTSGVVHRVATATFWRTLHHDGKISPGFVREGSALHTHPLSLYLPVPARTKLWRTLQLRGHPISPLPLYVLCGPSTCYLQYIIENNKMVNSCNCLCRTRMTYFSSVLQFTEM